MELIITKSDWGMDQDGDLLARMRKCSDAGFDGFEAFFVDADPSQFARFRAETGLTFVAGMVAPNPNSFRAGLKRVLAYDPILINCHGGRDYHTHAESLEYFTECMAIARDMTDVEVVFETHRRCNLYAPWTTERLINDLPDLRICADFSHFTVVSEGDMTTSAASEPDENGVIGLAPDPRKDAMMQAAISRSDHIHARVGDLHRPQCVDPRIGEGLRWTQIYEDWWDKIIARAKAEGRAFLTICPEYGPVPYAPADPETGIAISDPWDLSVWMKDRMIAKHRPA